MSKKFTATLDPTLVIFLPFFEKNYNDWIKGKLSKSQTKWTGLVKVGFSQKVMVKFSNLSNCHSCEPKIVPALLIPVNNNDKLLAVL